MPLPEYKNLTERELAMADHCAEIGDMAALRRYQTLSAGRENKTPDTLRFDFPMQPYPVGKE